MQLKHRAFALVSAIIVAGCGGGGGGSAVNSGTPDDLAGTGRAGTARFSINVSTGKVTVTPISGDASTRAIFSGSAARFTSSDLLNDTGELTRRKLSVQLKNNTAEPIGTPGSGFKVMFGDFISGASNPDKRSQTTVSTLVGDGGSGTLDGPALAARTSSPHSVLTHENGDVYFSGYDQKVRLLRNGNVSTITPTSVGPLTCMVWNSNGNRDYIYATALNTHRVSRIDVRTGETTVLAGTGSAGADDGPGATARFNLPYSLIDLGTGGANPDLLVAEGTTGKLRLMKYSGASYNVSTLPWTNDAPRGMYSLGGGRFVVAQAFLRKIAICDLNGQMTLLGTGASGEANGDGNSMQFFEPIGVFAPVPFSQGGRTIYVSESSGIIRQLTLRENGNVLNKGDWTSATIAGVSQAYGFADGAGDVARFLGPVCMATDLSGNIIVADSGNSRLRKIVPTNGIFPFDLGGANSGVDAVRLANATGFVPRDTGSMPYIQEINPVPVNGMAQLSDWSLIIPAGVKQFEFTVTIEAETTTSAPPDAVLNPGPNPAPGSSRAMVRTLAGAVSPGYSNGSVASALFSNPSAFAYDAQGVLYVADAVNHAIRRLTKDGVVTTLAGVPGNSGFADGNGAKATFGEMQGIAVNSAGDVVYVCDTTNNTIRRIRLIPDADPALPISWLVSTIAGAPGGAGYASGTGSVARFNGPFGLALTTGGELLVSEATGKRIRRLQLVGANPSFAAHWLVSLVAGDASEVTPAGSRVDAFGADARFGDLGGISVAPTGELYIADVGSSSVRRMSAAGDVTTFAGSDAGYADSDSGSAAKFNMPRDVAVDAAGYVYVADSQNNLIRRVSPAGAVRTVAGTGATGTADGPGNVAAFRALRSVAVSRGGDLVVGDGARVRLIERLISAGITQ
jgi:hypothetical protein